MWEQVVLYFKKAGTFILAASIVVWFITSYPKEVPYTQDYDALRTQTETTFCRRDDLELLAPLGLQSLADSAELAAVKERLETLAAEHEEAW